MNEPIKWSRAPRVAAWGEDMVVADIELDRDHTLTLYCEADQTAKVNAMFAEVEALRALIRLDDAEWHRSDTSGDSAATELHGPDPYAATRRAIVRRCCGSWKKAAI